MKISVILSIYNAELNHLNEAIDSILDQTYQNFEFVIVLNTPKTQDITSLVEEKVKQDSRIRIIKNESLLEICDSYNKGIMHASGEYIALMSADDISLPNRLEKQLSFMIENDYDLTGTNVIYIDEQSKVIRKRKQPQGKALYKVMPLIVSINFSSVMMKKTAFEKLHGFRDIIIEDRDLYLRFMTSGFKIENLDDYLVKYRFSDYQTSGEKTLIRMIAGEYVYRLYQYRIRKNVDADGFTKGNLEKFLVSKGARKIEVQERFAKAYKLYFSGLREIRTKKVNSLIKIIRAIYICPRMIYYLWVGIRVFIYRKIF
ncbi:MAG: glycosyltransferase [Erysipelotrichaceae bacterium]